MPLKHERKITVVLLSVMLFNIDFFDCCWMWLTGNPIHRGKPFVVCNCRVSADEFIVEVAELLLGAGTKSYCFQLIRRISSFFEVE